MKKNKYNSTVIICSAIGAITIMEIVALCNGINGTLFTLVIGAVAGLAGFLIPSPLSK